jgi:hypothetical protein
MLIKLCTWYRLEAMEPDEQRQWVTVLCPIGPAQHGIDEIVSHVCEE